MSIFRRRGQPPAAPKPSSGPSLEDQVAAVTRFGLRTGADPVADALGLWPRERYEAEPFVLLLAAAEWSADLKSFGDLEFLDEFGVYEDVIRGIAEWTGQDGRVTDVTASIDKATDGGSGEVLVVIDGEPHHYAPEYRGDWADAMALIEMAEDLAAPGRVVQDYWFDGGLIFAHLPREQAEPFRAFVSKFQDRL